MFNDILNTYCKYLLTIINICIVDPKIKAIILLMGKM